MTNEIRHYTYSKLYRKGQERFFPNLPKWWIPKSGPDDRSTRWNIKHITEHIESLGYEVVDSGFRQASPWWDVRMK